jgi:lipopolysaccharide biosynthesis glycosyltransferase
MASVNHGGDMVRLNLAIAFDEKYILPFYALTTSVLTHHANTIIHIHSIVNGLSAEQKQEIQDYLSPRASITFYHVNSEMVSLFVVKDKWTSAVYYRLFFPSLVPPSVKRLLYLDTDTIVCKDLTPVFEMDLEHYPLGAVYDNYVKIQPLLGIHCEGEYFNSGVLLMDLDKWRAQKISEQAIAYLLKYPENIRFVDQCALNAVLKNNWKKMPYQCNFMYSLIPEGLSKKELLGFSKDVYLVHFTLQRPWNMLCRNRFRDLYFFYLAKSGKSPGFIPYTDFALKKIPGWARIRLTEFYFDSKLLRKLWRFIKSKIQVR